MSDYGVKPSGFVRKPLINTLKDIELDLLGVFGPGLIQTSETPQGQINGVFSDAVNDLWELAEDVYRSLDPDQSESTRLESIGKLRILRRNGMSDIDFRQQINNKGITKFNLKDVEQALLPVEGITYLKAFLNDNGELTGSGVALGDVLIAVTGGDDFAIADRLLLVLPIGGVTAGETDITTSPSAAISQDFKIFRVVDVDVSLSLQFRLKNDTFDLFQPDLNQVITGFVADWQEDRINGRDVDEFVIRRLIECRYPNIELISYTAEKVGGPTNSANTLLAITFNEIAKISASDVTAVFV